MAQIAIRRGREQFPRRVHTIDELPEAVYGVLEQHHATHDLTKLIVIPPQQHLIPRTSWRRVLPFGWRWTPHRTLVFEDQQVLIIEGTRADAINTISIPILDLIALQVDVVLLYSYFALRWTTDQQIEHCKIEFNAVELRLFEPKLRQLQQIIAQTSLSHHHAPPPPVSTRHFPLKYHNYGRISLLDGEEIRFARYHPPLRQPGKHFRPFISPNRAILLTEQHLIVLEDELPHISHMGGSNYRINRVFYPRSKVLSARAETHSELDWLCVTVGTPDANEEVQFALPAADVSAFLRECDNWFLRTQNH